MRAIDGKNVQNLFAENIRKLLIEEKPDYDSIYEIRLRTGKPLFLVYSGGERCLKIKGREPYLVTGQDLLKQLQGKDLGEKLLLPCNMLKNEEDVFLDDISVEELSRKLNVEIVIVDEGGSDLVSAVLDPIEHKKQKRRQMYEQTGSSNCGQA